LNDVIGCYLDLEVGRIHWAKNGKEFPSAYSLRGEFVKAGLFPAVVIKVQIFFCRYEPITSIPNTFFYC